MADLIEETSRRIAALAKRGNEVLPAESYRTRDELSGAFEQLREAQRRIATISSDQLEAVARGARITGVVASGVVGGGLNGVGRRLIEHLGRNPHIGGNNELGQPKLPITYPGALGLVAVLASVFGGEKALGTVGTDALASLGVGLMAPDAAQAGYQMTDALIAAMRARSAAPVVGA